MRLFYKATGFVVFILLIFSGCMKYSLTSYDEIKRSNYVEIVQMSGEKIRGTVLKSEPHQLVILRNSRYEKVVSRSSIRSIMLKPPVYDDFGRGVSEEEIESVQTNRNAQIYGIGGGVLSLGTSFFIGSLIGESGNTVALCAGLGGTLGTYLFIRAGISKDRRDAVYRICEERKKSGYGKERDKQENKNIEELNKIIAKEKYEQEMLRRKREKLLKELEQEKKEKKKFMDI